MADFNLTREQAEAGIANGLKSIQYHKMLASWRHSCGAYLSIETPDESQGVYVIAWRSTAHYAATFERVKVFVDADPDIAWGSALVIAGKAFETGPGPAVVEAAGGIRARRQSAGRTGGTASGRNRQKGLISPEQAVSPVAETASPDETGEERRQLDKAAERDDKRDEDGKPILNLGLPNWRMEAQRGFGHITWAMMYYPNGKHDKNGNVSKDTDKTSVIWRNKYIPEPRSGMVPSVSKDVVDKAWEVSRWFRSSPEASLNGEDLAEGLTIGEAVLLVNRIIETTDPKKWVRGDFK